MHIRRIVRTGGQLGLLIGLGVLAALLIMLFVRSGLSPIHASVPSATRDGATRSLIPSTASPEQRPPSSTAFRERDSLAPGEPNTPLAAAPQLPATPSEIGPPGTAGPRAPSSMRDSIQNPAEFQAAEDEEDVLEYPLGWCFRTRPGGVGPWLEASPPDEQTHELTSDSVLVWSGSHSARLGAEKLGRTWNVDVIWQAIEAKAYRGSRVEFSARFQSRAALVHFFLRAIRSTDNELVLIDYTRPDATPQNFTWNGRADTWMRATIVHAVPSDADVILLGVAIYSGGHVWIDGAQLARVAEQTPLTNTPLVGGHIIVPLSNVGLFDRPTNLDFEATNLEPSGVPPALVGC